MVGYIQRNIRKFSLVLWIIVAAFVGTIFLVWGRATFLGFGGSYVAKVGEVEITVPEFERTYSKVLDFYRTIYKDKFNMELAQKLGLKEQALSMLVNRAVVLNMALKEGFTVSPEEIAEALASVKAFQVNGKFDPERYKQVLRLNGFTPVEFERELFNEILRRKMEVTVKSSVSVTEPEVKLFAKRLLQKAKIKYFLADIGDFSNMAEVSEEEAKSFYEKHQELFRTEPQLELQYVLIKPEHFTDKVLVTEEDIKKYYEENQDKFIDEKGKVKPLDKVKDEIIKEVRKEKARKEALKYALKLQRRMLKSTMELVCKKEGIPIAKVKLSPVSKIKLPKKVIKKALEAEEDKPTEVIRTEDGFYIVVVTRHIPSRIPSFDEVKEEAIQRLKVEKAPQAAQDWAKKLVSEKKSLEKIVKEKQLKYKVKESDFFTRKGLKVGDAVFRRLADKALQMSPGQKGFVLENGKLVVFEVKEFKEPSEKEIEEEAKKLKPALLNSKREEVWSRLVQEAKKRTEVKVNRKVWEAFR